MAFQLIRASEADLPFIMATERQEGYDAVVGRWDEIKHRAAIADGRHAYFIGRYGVANLIALATPRRKLAWR